jgi:hypothetical protein
MQDGGYDIRMTGGPGAARLLFLSANTNDRSPLAVDREYNRVRSRLQALGVWPEWRVAVEHVPAVAWEQLPEQLLMHAASIVHFAGHGHPDGSLEFSAHDGRSQRIHADGLARLFERYASQVRLIVLNACYSDALAAALTEHIDAVVGMPHAVSDEAAILFAPTFYQQLAGGKSVQDAFEVGRALLLGQASHSGSSPLRDLESLESPQYELPQLRVRPGVDATRMRFAPIVAGTARNRRSAEIASATSFATQRSPAAPQTHDSLSDRPDRTGSERAAKGGELLHDMYLRVLAGYAPDAVNCAARIAEIALTAMVGATSDTTASLGALIDELFRRGDRRLHGDASWLDERRTAARPFMGQVRGEFDDDARRACEIASRLAVAAGLVTQTEATACQRMAQSSASQPASSALLRLDRAMHRKILDDRLEHPRRVLVCLIHGEIDQGHDHFSEVMSWRLRSGSRGSWREVVVHWPQASASLGTRLATLCEDLAAALGVKLTPPRDDPATPDGAQQWLMALAPLLSALDARRDRLLVHHVLQCPRTGAGGDAALIEAYVNMIWATVATRAGERIVVGLNLRRIERGGFPMSKAWRISRAEFLATRAIAASLEELSTPHGCACITLPELTSAAAADLVDWLRAECARKWDAAAHEASQLVSSTRGGRFDLIVQRLSALNLERRRNTR